jgi:Fe2+ or Zn2+ uptake regulation protein
MKVRVQKYAFIKMKFLFFRYLSPAHSAGDFFVYATHMRTSAYKQRILTLFSEKHLLSMTDIHAAIPEADFSTVFRNVESLVAEGTVRTVLVNKDTLLYELTTHAHDHFFCTSCFKIEAVHSNYAALGIVHGSKVQTVTIQGICVQCVDRQHT